MKNQIDDNEAEKFVSDTLTHMVCPSRLIEDDPLECPEGLWCYEQFGPTLVSQSDNWISNGLMWDVNPNARWDCWERYGYGFVYYFRNAKDASLFKLVWG